jgi:hypothetical protein
MNVLMVRILMEMAFQMAKITAQLILIPVKKTPILQEAMTVGMPVNVKETLMGIKI